jgi:hypothetical protein
MPGDRSILALRSMPAKALALRLAVPACCWAACLGVHAAPVAAMAETAATATASSPGMGGSAAAMAPGASAPASSGGPAGPRRNWFDDPFAQATRGLPACPVPEGPLLTEAEMQKEAHYRAERGTSCFRSGRCRLPNAYLYDKEIAPRVLKTIDAAGQFENTSVWVQVQRRWVWLKGCVSTPEQAAELERIVRLIDDVEAVIPQLVVGTTMPPGTPPYKLAGGP